MPRISIKNFENAGEEGQYYTATCSHVHESEESDVAAKERSAWYRKMHSKGFNRSNRVLTLGASRKRPDGNPMSICWN